MKELTKGSRVYLIAIAGTGMSALAGLLRARGCEVAGSDLACYSPVKELLKELQIEVRLGYELEHLVNFAPDFVVVGNFVRRDNPQAQYVMAQGIAYDSLPGTLEKHFLTATRNTVVVGTHGKSTSSACLAHLLLESGRDPSFFIGAVPLNFERSFRLGSGPDFVLEGDEYDTAFFDKESKFLHYRPSIGVWTSLEFDHADIFDSLEDIQKMFRRFVQLIPEGGHLIYCRDSEAVHSEVLKLAETLGGRQVVSYGFHVESTERIEAFVESKNGVQFRLGGVDFVSELPGRFNVQNFSAALLAAKAAGVSFEAGAAALASFRGLKRRQEVRAEVGEHVVIDDFAHHPTAVGLVIEGMKKRYPEKRLVTLFEPRSNTTRRKIFQTEFASAFRQSDCVLLPHVFHVEAIPENDRLDLAMLVESLNASGVPAEGPLSTEGLVDQCMEQTKSHAGGVCFLILSNGSFDGLHQKLISALKSI